MTNWIALAGEVPFLVYAVEVAGNFGEVDSQRLVVEAAREMDRLNHPTIEDFCRLRVRSQGLRDSKQKVSVKDISDTELKSLLAVYCSSIGLHRPAAYLAVAAAYEHGYSAGLSSGSAVSVQRHDATTKQTARAKGGKRTAYQRKLKSLVEDQIPAVMLAAKLAEQNKSLAEIKKIIATRLGCSDSSVNRYLKDFDISAFQSDARDI